MTQTFPLYDQLLEESKEEDNQIDHSKLSSYLNSSKCNEMSTIMYLIIHHSIKNNNYISGKIPYSGVLYNGHKDVKYRVQDLPEELRRIIWTYISEKFC